MKRRLPTPPRVSASRHGTAVNADHTHACSVAVLLAAGALTCSTSVWAQSAGAILPSATLPALRGVVAGQAIVNQPTANGSGKLLTIDQRSSRAIIDWRSFNIGNGSEVRFNQPGSTASVLNRIYSADPSIIQGRLSSAGPIDPVTKLPTAGGQIILINQNGILFDRGSQVNAFSLVASTLNISNDFFNRGLLSGDNSSRPVPAFAGGYRIDGDGSTDLTIQPRGAIRVGSSGLASAAAPSITTPPGGNILLFAPVVDNRDGLITAPDGQVILAAGSKVYLAAEKAQAEGVRGFLVEVSAEGGDVNLSSLIRNQGTVTSDRGNVTLAGLAINQEGRVSASTATLYNGSVWLKAGSKKPQTEGGPLIADRSGAVKLGANSVTTTPLDTTDKTTLAESQAYASANLADDRRGQVRIEGRTIVHEGVIDSPGGRVTLDATSPVEGEFGRIYLAENSRINAAGAWADVALDSNFAKFRVTSTELKDAPDQKNGILKGANVTVDLRRSSSILDISGYVDGRRRTVTEKATLGGTVELQSTGDVIQRAGATVDVSGGGYRYQGGTIASTRLLGEDGRLYDISAAPKELRYTSQFDVYTQTFDRWGQKVEFVNPLGNLGQFESAYVEGRAGGVLSISAPKGLVLDGVLKGGVTVGPKQLARAPSGATLTLGTDLNRTASAVPVPAVRFTTAASDRLGPAFTADSTLPTPVANLVELSTNLLFPAAISGDDSVETMRFGQVEVNSRGLIEVPAEENLDVGTGNALVLRGNQIVVAGSINAPAGSVTLQTRPVPSSDSTPFPEQVSVLAGGSISVAGQWLNNGSRDGSAIGPTLPSAVVPVGATAAKSTTQGGSIAISSGSFSLQAGSTLDASGGGSMNRSGRIVGGNGGSITLAADRNPEPSSNQASGDLFAYSLATGGSLTVNAGNVQIGGDAVVADDVLRLQPNFFLRGGFTAYSVAGARGLTIAAGTDVRPKSESWLVAGTDALGLASGASLSSIASRTFLPDDLRPATSVTFSASGSPRSPAVLTMEKGASITTDPKGNVTLDAVNGMNVDGRITAPGAAIALTLRGATGTAPVLTLGDDAELLARGAFIAKPSDLGLRQGTLLDGGSVTLTATRGSIVASETSYIDVSGISQTIDVASTDPRAPAAVTRVAGSNAGTVTVRAQERSTFASQLDGQAGTATTAGGSFAMEFTNRDARLRPSDVSVDRRILVTQAPSSLAAQAGVVDIAVDGNRLSSGGFDKVRLQAGGRIEFLGRTALDMARGVQLDAPEIRVADGARVDITGQSVVLANSFGAAPSPGFQGTTGSRNNLAASRPVATRAGTGEFHVDGGVVDLLGDITLNGVSSSTLVSDSDIRLSGRVVGDAQSAEGARLIGSLVSQGDITLQSAQMYPTTKSDFTVAVQKRSVNGSGAGVITPQIGGLLRIEKGESAPGSALSADGALTLRADRIVQGGVVKAPLGRIAIDARTALELAAGSVTSVSALGLTLPYGTTIDQRDWSYTPTNSRVDINALVAPPSKAVTLSAPSIDIAAGSQLDLSGGGDVQSSEFVPGTGGSSDTLLKDNTFAIMPAAKLSSLPVDREIAARKDLGLGLFAARQDALAYDSIHIGAGAMVPEGDYVLLPGRYALLPDAYLVNLKPGSTYANLAAGQKVSLPNGQVVVPGYRKVAGTSVREDQTIGVVVRTGSSAKTESDYTLLDSDFFAKRADRLRLATPALPGDGGRLSIAASSGLKLDGDIRATAATSANRDAAVDIAAPKIAVVDAVDSSGLDASFLKIGAANLSRIGGSLLLGGTRTDTASGVRLSASASEVVFANDTELLEVPELLVAATDSIKVRTGSELSGAGKRVVSPASLTADSQGALVRLSSGAATEIRRGAVSGSNRGTVTIESDAKLSAEGSVAIDATLDVQNQGKIEVSNGGALALAAGAMTLGGTGAGTTGLVLGQTALRDFDLLGSLSLKSYGAINFVDGVILGSATLDQLVLDTPRLRAVGGAGNAVATAKNITLRNSGSKATTASTGAGNLALNATNITLADGAKAIEGFATVSLNAAGHAYTSGIGSLLSAGATRLEAASLVGLSASDQTLKAGTDLAAASGFDLVLAKAATAAVDTDTTLGGGARLALEGKSVVIDAPLSMKSGIVDVRATGSGATDGVTLRSSGSIDVGSKSRTFAGQVATADAGSVSLSAVAGDIATQAGSKIVLAGAATAGDAGRLALTGRSVQLEGTIDAHAVASAQQGRVAIDAASVADFTALNSKLKAAGFEQESSIRARTGDLRVAAADTVKARNIRLQADSGRVDVDGRLDASSAAGGGRIELFAGTGLQISGQADASGTSTASDATARPSNGGEFVADTRSGTLTLGEDATVDVRAGAKGKPGSALFTAARTADNGINVDLQGTVSTRRTASGAAGDVVVQGRKVVTDVAEATADNIQQWSSEHAEFMSAVGSAVDLSALRTDGTKRLRGVLELQTPGDFTFGTDWDLTTSEWLAGTTAGTKGAGTLTVRAGGDVVVKRFLGLPDDRLVDGATWSIQLASGADLSAANPLSLASLGSLGNKGNFRMAPADAPTLTVQLNPSGNAVIDPNTGEPAQVTVDQLAKIRTGSGSLSIAAGRDFIFERGNRTREALLKADGNPLLDTNGNPVFTSSNTEDAKRVIYTAGLPTAPFDQSAFVVGIDTPWADGGGDVSIVAQRDAIGDSNQWINGWLRRPRGSGEEAQEGGWFVYRPNFQQNVGALAGGDVTIAAGRDVLNLSAVAPTMGRVIKGSNTQTLEVTGGGNVTVTAGNRIEGGEYLVGRGTGRLDAGSSVGAVTPTQVFLMGESNDPGQLGASMKVTGRTGVTLQSVDNPTALALPQSKALGPAQFRTEPDADGNPLLDPDSCDSEGNCAPFYLPLPAQNFAESTQNAASTFYTYSPNASLSVQSMSGDVVLGGRPLGKPDLAQDTPASTNRPVNEGSAYPGIVKAVAFDGSIRGSANTPLVTMFPTTVSSLGLYAAADVNRVNFFASDRALAEVAAWDRPSVVPTGLLGISANTPRVVLAPSTTPFRYDVVADTGSVLTTSLQLPDQARVQAGLDIVGASLQLQNQKAEDVSVVRAVNGDVRPNSLTVAGPGRLLVQAGRNIDLGSNAVQAIGNTRNATLGTSTSAHLTFIAGVPGDIDVSKLDGAFLEFTDLNKASNDALALYRLLDAESDPQRVLQATTVADLAAQNPKYERYVELGKKFPRILGVYQDDLKNSRVPLGSSPAVSRAAEFYALLNAETDEARVRQILSAGSLQAIASLPEFATKYAAFTSLDQQFPTLFTDYQVRRSNGFLPSSLLPIVFSGVLDESVAKVFPGAKVTHGNIDSYLTSIQTIGGSGIDLIAPAGDITVGLTTPRASREIGVITTGGGGIRSYLSGNFNINQGKVVTAQGGDILIFSDRGNIDAGRGARTSQTSPAPIREPVVENGVVVGFISKIPAGFSGSGIQTLSSDPDGQGPLAATRAGAVLLFTPAGFVDAGEAGIASGGDIFIVAQTVLNSTNISSAGASVGVPVATSGSLATSLAGSGTANNTKAGEDAAASATNAARAAAAAEGLQKPTILTVEVLGFGDKNCKEQQKDCFVK